MSTAYASEHADALADLTEAGSAIVFTKTTITQDDTTGAENPPTTSTHPAVAIRVKGDPILYRDLGLTETEAPTLLIAPGTPGDLPPLDSNAPWGTGSPHRVRHVNPLDLDGQGAILARVVIVR